MHAELLNLWLFAQLIAKVLLVTGIGPGLVFTSCFRGVRAIKISLKSSGDGQLAHRNDKKILAMSRATSPSRKVWRHA